MGRKFRGIRDILRLSLLSKDRYSGFDSICGLGVGFLDFDFDFAVSFIFLGLSDTVEP